jgi:hypothetical protein
MNLVVLTREATVGESASAQESALGLPGLLGAATAVAPHEDGEAGLRVTVRLHLRRLRLQPADGPIRVVGLGPGQAAAAVGWHDDHVVLPVDPALPAAAPLIPDLPLPRAAAGGGTREGDGVWLPEAGGEVREGGARQGRGGELVVGHPRRGSRPQPVGESAQPHGHDQKNACDPFDQIKKIGKIEQNPVFPGSAK